MRTILVLAIASTVSSLKCKDIIIGETNGTSFNFVNTLVCPPDTKWCTNLNVSFHSPLFSVDGFFGNCETNGFVGTFLNLSLPMEDLFCKEAGCVFFPMANLTRCCCNTDLCNNVPSFSVFFAIFSLLVERCFDI